MTDHQPDPGTDAAEAYATEYQRLWDATVATLTAAVQLDHPQHGPVDFSDFLASALGAVAANVGSAYRITAGRPGSWESDALGQLVGGTVGYDADPVELAPRRTLPVLVPLNVAQLFTERGSATCSVWSALTSLIVWVSPLGHFTTTLVTAVFPPRPKCSTGSFCDQ